MTDDKMGELRSILHEAPSSEGWSRLRQILFDWQDDTSLFEQALPYAHNILSEHEQWAQLTRAVPEGWTERLVSNGGSADTRRRARQLCCLASELRLDFHRTPYRADPLPAITYEPFDPPFLTRKLTVTGDSESIQNWVEAAQPSLLEELNFGRAEGSVTAPAIKALLDAVGEHGSLHTVDCWRAWLETDAALILAEHPAMRTVRTLDMRYNAYIRIEGRSALLESSVLHDEVKAQLNDQYEDIFE